MGLYTLFFQPVDHIIGRKLLKKTVELLFSPGIKLHQLGGLGAGIGHIAAAATGDADFAEHLTALFQQRDLVIRVLMGDVDGGKETGGSPSTDDDLFFQGLMLKVKGRRGAVAGFCKTLYRQIDHLVQCCGSIHTVINGKAKG